MYRFIIIAGLVSLMLQAGVAVANTQAGADLRYVDIQQSAPAALVVDTRSLDQCQKRSIAGAHCLPAHDLLGPKGELPNFADIFWALGTAGIEGSETVLVAGDDARRRDYVAGLLYLCGQAQVQVLKTPIEQVLREGLRPAGAGQPRAMLRQRIYRAVMRDKLLVLPGETQSARQPEQNIVPIDADSDSANEAQLVKNIGDARHTGGSRSAYYLIHAAKPMAAIALFTRLQARVINQGIKLRVMPVSASSWNVAADKLNITNAFTASKEPNNQFAANDKTTTLLIGLVVLSLAAMLMLVAMLPTKGGKQWT